jgi:hypothetical protein
VANLGAKAILLAFANSSELNLILFIFPATRY